MGKETWAPERRVLLVVRNPTSLYRLLELVDKLFDGTSPVRCGPFGSTAEMDGSCARELRKQLIDIDRYTPDRQDVTKIEIDPPALDAPTSRAHPQPCADADTALSWLDTECRNLLASQLTVAAHHRHNTVWHPAWTLNTFHYRRGHHHDDDLAARQAGPTSPTPPSAPASTATSAAPSPRWAGTSRPIANLDHSLTIAEARHVHTHRAHTHYDLSGVFERMGDLANALTHARRALESYRGIGQPVWQAGAPSAVGRFAARLRDHDAGETYCHEALDRNRANGNVEGKAGTLGSSASRTSLATSPERCGSAASTTSSTSDPYPFHDRCCLVPRVITEGHSCARGRRRKVHYGPHRTVRERRLRLAAGGAGHLEAVDGDPHTADHGFHLIGGSPIRHLGSATLLDQRGGRVGRCRGRASEVATEVRLRSKSPSELDLLITSARILDGVLLSPVR